MTTKPDTKPAGKPRAHHDFNLRRKAVYLAVASCFSITPAFAGNPQPLAPLASYNYFIKQGGMYQAETNAAGTRTIYNTNGTILNWYGGLNINTGETLNFQQLNASSKILNRVSGGNMTQILGTLSSNGKVYLINNAGVVVGAGATIQTAGFVASSLSLSNDDFNNGKNRFTASRKHATGSVSNAGTITTPNGGFVYLIGAQVENSGIINTPSGEAILAAGSSVELVDSADPSMRVKVSANALPVNLSQLMTQSNGNIFSVLNSGKISANSAVVGQNGKIQLRSAGALTTTATSVLEAKGDANSDGGLIRGFADGVGTYAGSFNVSGRNGGKIETSAAYLNLDPNIAIAAKALAPGGHNGSWLLDPYDFTIGTSEANSISAALSSGSSVTIDTGDGFYGDSTPSGAATGTSGVGRITMTNAHITASYSGFSSLTLNANESVVIDNSSITSSGSQFNFEITAASGVAISNSSITGTGGMSGFDITAGSGIVISNSAIQTNNGGHLGVSTSSGDIGISGSQLTSLNPPSSGASINIGTSNGNVTIDNSSVQFATATPYAGLIGISATNGNVNVINQSQIGAPNSTGNANDLHVNIGSSSGNINIANSNIGVQAGPLGSSIVNLNATGGNITMIGADATHRIRAHAVDLIASLTALGTGNIGQSGHFIVTEADTLAVGNSQTQNAFVTDLGLLQSANFRAVNDAELQLQQGASLDSYGSISFDSQTALIASAGDITLNNHSSIDFSAPSGDGSFVIATNGSIMLDNSYISASASYGSASLNLFTGNLSMDHGSSIDADFVGLNYDIGSPGTDAAKRLALAAFAKNSTVNIAGGSYISAGDGVGMIAGKMNIVGGAIISDSDLDLLVAGDLNLSGTNGGGSGYSSFIGATTEAFITVGGHLNINTSSDGTNEASIEVASGQTLFMNFPGTTKNGWSVDGVANAFDSTILPGKTGIFVNGAPGVIGTNTFISYGRPTSALASVANSRNNDLLTNPLGNSTVANNQDAADKFFGKDDDSKDEGDSKGSGKKGKDKPKECS
ncbi:MAG TPA: filamentous hemagglutinin N-terminal domain-containing protein [Methylophilaceae bacterium]|jgi:filamentous hemagglutinin family protein